jgi:hypothetical protein
VYTHIIDYKALSTAEIDEGSLTMEFRDAVEASDTDRMIAVTSFHMNEAG